MGKIIYLEIGNVCAARLYVNGREATGQPHQPLINPETKEPVERFSMRLKVTEHVCKLCGCVYVVDDE